MSSSSRQQVALYGIQRQIDDCDERFDSKSKKLSGSLYRSEDKPVLMIVDELAMLMIFASNTEFIGKYGSMVIKLKVAMASYDSRLRCLTDDVIGLVEERARLLKMLMRASELTPKSKDATIAKLTAENAYLRELLKSQAPLNDESVSTI